MYAQVILTTAHRAPLFAVPRLRRLASRTLYAHRANAPCTLWAYAVQPCTVRLIIGPIERQALDIFVEEIKSWLATPILQAICDADDDSLDAVLHYNPVWGGAIYRLWEAGYHRVPLGNAFRLSRGIHALRLLRETGADVWIGGA